MPGPDCCIDTSRNIKAVSMFSSHKPAHLYLMSALITALVSI